MMNSLDQAETGLSRVLVSFHEVMTTQLHETTMLIFDDVCLCCVGALKGLFGDVVT